MRCKAGMFSARTFTYNLAAASFVGDLSVGEATPTGIAFKPDGEKMYHIGTGSDLVREFDLSTPWDITSASLLQSFSVNAQEVTPQAVAFSSDGLKMFIVGNGSDAVQEYDLATAWDVSSASHSQSFSVSTQDGNPAGMAFSANGDKMFIAGIDGDDINEYALSTAWDISTASYVQSFSILSEEGIVNGVAFSVDGSKMFIVGVSGDEVNEYALSTAWDISTASYVQNFSVASEDNTPRDLAFSVDGLRMYIVGDQNNKVYEYSLV